MSGQGGSEEKERWTGLNLGSPTSFSCVYHNTYYVQQVSIPEATVLYQNSWAYILSKRSLVSKKKKTKTDTLLLPLSNRF